MERLVKILEENKYKFFCKGVYTNGQFYELPDGFKLNCVKVQIKKEFEFTLLKMFAPFYLKEIVRNKYEIVFSVGNDCFLFVEFAVNSHVIIPAVVLKDFKSDDTKIYYINSKVNEIKDSSVKNFNTMFGYFSLRFEEFLSKNYETKLGNIKKSMNKFCSNEIQGVYSIGMIEDIKDFLDISFIRNPKHIHDINNKSLLSRFLFKGYTSEMITEFNCHFKTHLFVDLEFFIVVNRTSEGLLLSGELFSNIFLKDNVQGIIIPLHPKYGIILVPKVYYEKKILEYSRECHMVIDNLKVLRQINRRIYIDCKKHGINIVGIKSDLKKVIIPNK